MPQRPEPPAEVVSRLRGICLALPDAYEERAWAGVRWRIRSDTFAHVLMVADGWPPAYARAAGAAGPMSVVTFRSAAAERDPRRYAEAPFFRPRWRPGLVALRLDEASDWDAVAELIAGSYRLLAPLTLGPRDP